MNRIEGRIGTLAGGLAAIAMTVAILLSGAAVIKNAPASDGTDFILETPDGTVPDADTGNTDEPADGELPFVEPDAGAAQQTTTKVERGVVTPDTSIRRVAPDEFSFTQEKEGTRLERIEAREPLSKVEPKKKPETTLLPHPVPVSAGEINFGRGTIRLGGLAEPDINRTCTDDAGRSWPCGMAARTALRNFIRGRALTCSVPEREWEGTVTAACTLAGLDIATWLASNGWADPAPGSALERDAALAKAEKRGAFGKDPRAGL